MESKDYMNLLLKGVDYWNDWRENYPENNPDLGNVNLSNYNLQSANLSRTFLFEANLSGANLQKANLQEAFLCRANLDFSNLKEAMLHDAWLEGVDLYQAKFWCLAKGIKINGIQRNNCISFTKLIKMINAWNNMLKTKS